MVNFIAKDKYTFDDLIEIVRLLRAPGGCPWDQEQTHHSIRRNFLEEAYEACEAIDEDNADHMCEELGDVLLQVLFHADIERERGRFTIDEVADGVCKKLIFRHPHVFGTTQADNTEQVLTNWDALKRVEKGQQTDTDTLHAVARSLPALWRAEKIQKKAEKAGIAVPTAVQAQALIISSAQELSAHSSAAALGHLLFLSVAACRAAGIDPEQALTTASDQFIEQFASLESASQHSKTAMAELTADQLGTLWSESSYSSKI